MSPLRTIGLVANREIRQRARSKLLVWTTLGMSLLLTGLALLPLVLGLFDDDRDEAPAERTAVEVGVVGTLSPTESAAIEVALGTVAFTELADEPAAVDALLAEDVSLAVVPGQRVLVPPARGILGLGNAHASAVASALGTEAVLPADGSAEDVAVVLAAPPLPVEQVGDDDPAEVGARLAVANLGVVFLFGVLIMYSSMIINGVIEEKGSRVVELLVEAVPVPQLMAGKLLGLGAVGLAQTFVLFVPPTVVLVATARDLVPPGVGALTGLILLWFLLGYALYAVIAAGLGSLVSRPEEAQAVLTPANLLMIAGYFTGFVAIQAPDALFARIASLVPFSAPYVMLVRQVLGSPSILEVVVSIVLVLLTTVGATFLAARIYRGGILRTGGRVRLRDAWRAADD